MADQTVLNVKGSGGSLPLPAVDSKNESPSDSSFAMDHKCAETHREEGIVPVITVVGPMRIDDDAVGATPFYYPLPPRRLRGNILHRQTSTLGSNVTGHSAS